MNPQDTLPLDIEVEELEVEELELIPLDLYTPTPEELAYWWPDPDLE